MVDLGETLKRLLVAFIAIPIVLYFVFLREYPVFPIFVLISSILMTLELLSIAEVKSIRTHKIITLTSIILIILSFTIATYYPNEFKLIFKDNFTIIIIILLISTFTTFLFETFQAEFTKTLETVSSNILILLYCAVSMGFLILLQNQNPFYLLFIWIITWMTDSGAYFCGKYLGKHKLNLKSSPNKTLEGFIGGVLVSIISGVLFKLIYESINTNEIFLFSYPILILITFVFAIISIFGDLAESIMKRSSGIKDSKSYIPGHGGMLDVMDSIVYTAPIFYYLLFYLNMLK